MTIARSSNPRTIIRILAIVLFFDQIHLLMADPPMPPVRSQRTLVTGPDAEMQAAVAQGSAMTFTLQPVPPKTVPFSDYPPGTTIVGQTITLGAVPARVWLELHVTAWDTGTPCDSSGDADDQGCLKTAQAKIDAVNGFMGANADCGGGPGGADLQHVLEPCTTNTQCRATHSGITSACFGIGGASEPSQCRPRQPWMGAGGNVCDPGFQDLCDPEWIGSGVGYVPAADITAANFRFGVAMIPPDVGIDFMPSYMGTMLVDVPGGAKGAYTLGFVLAETFWRDNQSGIDDPPLFVALNPAIISVPCGRCCFGYGSGKVGCVDGVSSEECNAEMPDSVFQPDESCPENGGPTCPLCATDANCDDGVDCTIDRCGPADGACHNLPSDAACDDGLFCNGAETCDPAADCIPGIPPCVHNEECDEEADFCDPSIPTMGAWGLVVLVLLLLIGAKAGFRSPSARIGGSRDGGP